MLKDRILSYQSTSDYSLLNRVPIIIEINGRSFSKVTSLLDKPYSLPFAELMASVMYKLCIEIDGVVFAYQFNDEIVLVLRNDQSSETEPWYDNKVQKICSTTASLATNYFNKLSNLNLVGDAIFRSHVFPVPNVSEAINTIIYKQQNNFYTTVQSSCIYELLKNYDKNAIKSMTNGLSIDEKIDLLSNECQIDYYQYPHSFRRGVACYRAGNINTRSKWVIDHKLPIFSKEQFLSNIIK